MREEGKQDKELSSFLVVSRDEVPQICQNGLCTGDSKREINIMKELGNPQLGVYLFRYVDIALNYASKHSFPVENIIIFRVSLYISLYFKTVKQLLCNVGNHWFGS